MQQLQQQQRFADFRANALIRARPVVLQAQDIISGLDRNLPAAYDAQLAGLFTKIHNDMQASGLDPSPWLRDLWTTGYAFVFQYESIVQRHDPEAAHVNSVVRVCDGLEPMMVRLLDYCDEEVARLLGEQQRLHHEQFARSVTDTFNQHMGMQANLGVNADRQQLLYPQQSPQGQQVHTQRPPAAGWQLPQQWPGIPGGPPPQQQGMPYSQLEHNRVPARHTGMQGLGANNPVPQPLQHLPGLTSAAREHLRNPGAAPAAATYAPASGGNPANFLASSTQGLQTKDIMNHPPTEKMQLGDDGSLRVMIHKNPSQPEWTKWMTNSVLALTFVDNGVSVEEAANRQQLKATHVQALFSVTTATELQKYLCWALGVMPSTTWESFLEFDLELREEIKRQGTPGLYDLNLVSHKFLTHIHLRPSTKVPSVTEKKRICKSFNSVAGCRFKQNCKNKHVCMKCKQKHPSHECTK